ncbi:MAG: hypothetical protein ACOCPW_05245 [Marinilabiliaceae bacterium]
MKTSTAKIKNHLHKLIVETDDESILHKVDVYFKSLKSSQDEDWWVAISEQEKTNIKTGLQQLKDGKKIPHEDVKLKADKLLGRK